MKKILASLMSVSLLFSLFPTAAFAAVGNEETIDIEPAEIVDHIQQSPVPNLNTLEGGTTDGDTSNDDDASLTKEQAKMIPGGIYEYEENGVTHKQQINSTFDFVEDNIAYKVVDESTHQVEVAAWEWSWACGQGGKDHPHANGSWISTEYNNRESGIEIPATVSHENQEYTVVGIGRSAFMYVDGTPITLPEGITYIGAEAFHEFNGGTGNTLTIPASVKEIGEGCFGQAEVTSITFSDNSQLETVGDEAFSECDSLTELVLPEGVKHLGASVFQTYRNEGVLKVTIPGTVEDFDSSVLTGYNGTLDSITFTEGPANFIKQEGILYGYNKLLMVGDKTVTSVNVPDGITELGEGAFSGCNSLQSVTLPDSLTTIGDSAFKNRTSLQSITGGKNVVSLGSEAFSGCTALAQVDFSSLEKIGYKAFNNCTSLTQIDLSNATEIGQGAFYSCSKLAQVDWPSGLESMGKEAFVLCTALKEVEISGSVQEIPEMAFWGCTALESVVLQEGVTTIGKNAFDLTEEIWNDDYTEASYVNENPQLKSINIPSTVTSVGEYFLRGIKENNETALIFEGNTPPTFESKALAGISGEGVNQPTVYYPAEAVEAYTAEGSDLVTNNLVSAPVEGEGNNNQYSLTVTPSATSVYENNTISFTVESTLPQDAALTVGSSDTTVATAALSSDQKSITVTGVKEGTATITVSIKLGDVVLASESVTVTVDERGTSGSSSSGTTRYTVSVEDTDNGTVKVSPTRASKGSTVTITVTPDEGYELDKLVVTDKNSDAVKLIDKGDGKYTFTMPRSAVTVEATFAEIGTEPESPVFTDVPASAYYYDAVLWAVENGVTEGTNATTFSPDMSCTRAQMVTFLWRAAGSPEPVTTTNPFTDVNSGVYYYDAVLWAVEQGITSGTSATTFAPDATCTRAQTVTFLYRAAGSPAVSGGSFADVSADAYYADAVAWAVSEGVTVGTSDTTFSPDMNCTRAQIVTFMYRAAQ